MLSQGPRKHQQSVLINKKPPGQFGEKLVKMTQLIISWGAAEYVVSAGPSVFRAGHMLNCTQLCLRTPLQRPQRTGQRGLTTESSLW